MLCLIGRMSWAGTPFVHVTQMFSIWNSVIADAFLDGHLTILINKVSYERVTWRSVWSKSSDLIRQIEKVPMYNFDSQIWLDEPLSKHLLLHIWILY